MQGLTAILKIFQQRQQHIYVRLQVLIEDNLKINGIQFAHNIDNQQRRKYSPKSGCLQMY